MTTRPATAQERPWRHPAALRPAVALLVAVLAILVGAAHRVDTHASTGRAVVAGTRVRVHDPAQQAVVGATRTVLAGQGRETSAVAAGAAIGSRVAPRSVTGGGSTTFHTVQSAADESRLLAGGTPWPTAPNRAHLGEGVYAWGNRADAESYLNHLTSRGACDLRICSFQVNNADLAGMRHLDVDSLANPSAFMQKYSSLWGGTPNHGYEYVTRGTNFGTEHFFSSSVFDKLRFGGA